MLKSFLTASDCRFTTWEGLTFPRGICFSQSIYMCIGGDGGWQDGEHLCSSNPQVKQGQWGRGELFATEYRDAFIDFKKFSKNTLCVTACAG